MPTPTGGLLAFFRHGRRMAAYFPFFATIRQTTTPTTEAYAAAMIRNSETLTMNQSMVRGQTHIPMW